MTRKDLISDKGMYKPNLSPASRSVEPSLCQDLLNEIIIDAAASVKEVILKIDCGQSYDKNFKILNGFDNQILKDTLIFMRSIDKDSKFGPIIDTDKFLKNGLIHETINTLSRLLPYKCHGCKNKITYRHCTSELYIMWIKSMS